MPHCYGYYNIVLRVKMKDYRVNSQNKRNYMLSKHHYVTGIIVYITQYRQGNTIQSLQSELRLAPKQEYVNR